MKIISEFLDYFLTTIATLTTVFIFLTLGFPYQCLIIALILFAYFSRNDSVLLGSLALVTGVFDANILLVFAMYYIYRKSNFRKITQLAASRPILIICLTWCIIIAIREATFNFSSFSSLNTLLNYPPEYLLRFQSYLKCFVFFSLIKIFQEQNSLKDFWKGSLFAIPFAILILILQYFNFPGFWQLSEYWQSQTRLSASFTDPNCFAIVSILLAGYCLFQANRGLKFLAIFILLAASYSGSRTLIIAIIIYALIYLAKSKHKIMVLGVSVVCAIIFVIAAPASFERVVDTVKLKADALYSRQIFNKLSLNMFIANPISGIGFNRYRDEIPNFSHKIDSKFGTWTDNANNYYFEQLVELGMLGVLAWLIFILAAKSKLLNSRYAVYVFLLLLGLGSHLEFVEVSIFFAALLATNYTFNRQIFPAHLQVILCLVCICLIFNKKFEYGLYPEEQESSGYFEWTSGKFCTVLKCNNQRQVLNFRVHPQNAGLKLKNLSEMNFSTGEHKLEFDCNYDSLKCALVNKTFIPGKNDNRELGIQILNAN